ncbi:MraY family glycosyltransferase [Aquipseudomonas alcaligenes]|uniref:Glycosyltransferase family 4 protein n=1 Tax=Aquipseudomonas alcaligenes TaxID=43263 RepID=A0AB73HSZ0_AQUAC|nr:glycosyltransferase family 4 protein [Pseudomonas alcaligenes]MDH0140995.1 glycosyltransferase family 4 protein [Pseudomonas alcaligenes]
MLIALVLSVTLLGSWAMTWGLRRYALAHNVLDVPNSRSSHQVPTPRGGGMAIVVASSLALAALALSDLLPAPLFYALSGSGALVALVGFVDDHRPLSARWRLLAHFLAAAWGLFWLGGMPEVRIPGVGALPGWLWGLLGLVYLVWLLNLYNFMDGIDGIAGTEAICVCLGGAILFALAGRYEMVLLPVLLALASAGFLFWNFPSARIFMGDAGSGYLGLLLGLFSLQAAWVAQELFWSWLILLGVFIVDASLTLLRRLLQGSRVYEAHRSHAYQHAARQLGGHLPVTLAVAVINLCWLLPLSLWAAHGGYGFFILLLAYAPLILLALRYRAGLAG